MNSEDRGQITKYSRDSISGLPSVLCQALLDKGFRKDPTHYNMFWYHVGGKKAAVRTQTSQGEKECNHGMLTMGSVAQITCFTLRAYGNPNSRLLSKSAYRIPQILS